MTEGRSIADFIKSLPTATDFSGRSVILADASGNLTRASLSMIADALGSTGKMMTVYTIPAYSDLDADTLTRENTIYRPVYDLNVQTKIKFDNFPERPEGGFSLIVLKEANYLRQIYMIYELNAIYMRCQVYKSGTKWGKWQKLSPDPE